MAKIVKKCQGFESYQRLNYLAQLAEYASNNFSNTNVSAYYGNLIQGLAKKTMTKIDSNIKRHICKRCKVTLLPGKTVTVKTKSKRGKTVVRWTCMSCKFVRRYPVDGNKKMWCEKQESIAELLQYSNNDERVSNN